MLNASFRAVRAPARLAKRHARAVCGTVIVIIVEDEKHAARYRESQEGIFE